MTRKSIKTIKTPKTLILGINAPYNKTKDIEAYFSEFKNLVRSDLIDYDEELFIKIRDVNSAFFISKGKLENIAKFCKEKKIEDIIISEPLTSIQIRNLEDLLNCEIKDRTDLILEIFEKSAKSAEGKTQVNIAQLEHEKTRLAGKGIELEQQAGRIGGKGPGETLKEKEIRLFNQQIQKYKKLLKKLQQVRETQRKKRLETKEPHICLVGYTNAGKSTILNLLTKSSVLAKDILFATLDTTTRAFYIDGKKKGIISDTVGFIQQLPTKLIEAFKSTLSELQYADLLLVVTDISDPNLITHLKVIHGILEDLKLDKEILYVFNKKDKVKDIKSIDPTIENFQPQVKISALSKQGTKPLIDFLRKWHPRRDFIKKNLK